MDKLRFSILITVFMMATLAGCVRSYTASQLRETEPLAAKKISKSPEKAVYCIAELMDEKMSGKGKIFLYISATNHVRIGDKRASVVSFISGTPELLSVVEVKALESGSQATFHRVPNAVRETESVRKINEVFRECS